MNRKRTIILVTGAFLFVLCGIYVYLFYPQQQMPVGQPVGVTTPDSAVYHNDCLHPCIRYSAVTGKYYMAQSPYYAWNNRIENPLFYQSSNYRIWHEGRVLANTPISGFNSDPCILLDGDSLYYLWREYGTPLCDSLHCSTVIVGDYVQDGAISSKHILAVNKSSLYDMIQCPIIMKSIGGGGNALVISLIGVVLGS